MEGLFFYIFGTLAVIAALATITRRDPVTSAFWLIFCFLNVAALFAVLQAHLMAALQILIYAGAIMVFFLFVTMFLGKAKRSAAGPNRFLFGIGLVTVLAMGRPIRKSRNDRAVRFLQPIDSPFGMLVANPVSSYDVRRGLHPFRGRFRFPSGGRWSQFATPRC